jgi:mannose-1-phosphate guanylyltransferase/phosphomannomutase
VVIRFFDKDGIDVDETTQRKIERLYHREDFRRVLAREIGDIEFPPRALELYTAALIDSVDLEAIAATPISSWSSTTPSAPASFVMPNVLAKLEAEVLVVNPYANTAGVSPSTGPSQSAGSPSWCGRRAPTWGPSSTPAASTSPSSTTWATLTDDEALLVLLDPGGEAHPGIPCGPPGGRPSAAEEICRRKAGAEIVWTKLSASHLMEVARSERRHLAASQSGGFIFPRSCPPTTPPPPWSTCWHVGRHRPGSCPSWWRSSPRAHRPSGGHTPWEQKGTVMRTLVERSKGP